MGNCNWINNNNNNQYTNNQCKTNTCATNTCNTDPHNNGNKPATDECCCCPESMRKALNLLSNSALANYINFDQFAFVASQIAVGGTLDAAVVAATNPSDNLAYDTTTPTSFQCVECNLVRISPSAFNIGFPSTAAPATTTLNYLSLCDVAVVKFPVDDELFTPATPGVAINECYPNCVISSWNNFKSYFRSLLDKNVSNNCQCACDPCCCENDILNKVNSCITGVRGTTINIAAEAWFGVGLEVLGSVGCVLVLTDNFTTGAEDPSIFFVCLDRVSGFNA